MTIYDISIPDEYKDKTSGEIKTKWYTVGVAFPLKSGKGFSMEIPSGISVTGRVMLMERKEKAPEPASVPPSE